jgi:ubiquinone/menaquinone biosynthesis C-methylase UbiE
VFQITSFRQGNAESLPFKDGGFDAVISECSFCIFTDKAKTAGEMARVLGRGGRLGMTDVTVR